MKETTRTIASYDASASAFAQRWFDYRLEEAVHRFASRLPAGALILDVGCGVGRDVQHLSELGFAALGIDLSTGMLAEARRRVKATFIQADMRRLPFASGCFDALWICASLFHLPKTEAPHVLEECRRVLDRGHLFLAVRRGKGERWMADLDKGRARFFAYYQPSEIKNLAEKAGLQIVDAWQNPPGPGQSEPWLHLIAACHADTRPFPVDRTQRLWYNSRK
ncbi:MAG: class I SAM-dependent methyltransferase [Chloroflexota bacterium]